VPDKGEKKKKKEWSAGKGGKERFGLPDGHVDEEGEKRRKGEKDIYPGHLQQRGKKKKESWEKRRKSCSPFPFPVEKGKKGKTIAVLGRQEKKEREKKNKKGGKGGTNLHVPSQ